MVHDTQVDAGLIIKDAELSNVSQASLEEIFESSTDTVFYCVPMSAFEPALKSHIDLLNRTHRTLIADVLSVKTHPKQVMERHLPSQQEGLLTHPMFGPDGVREAGLQGQRIIIDKFRTSDARYGFWLEYLKRKGLAVIEMKAEEHDRLAAESQGIVHFVGRVLARFGLQSTAVDTLNARKLQEIAASVNRDTWELFIDLQTLNPYMPEVRRRFAEAEKSILADLAGQKKSV